MLLIANMTIPVILAIALSLAMMAVAFWTWFYHDSKHRDLDSWIEYGFSRDTLHHVLIYYRSMGIAMLVFYVLFVVSCLLLEAEGHQLFVTARGDPVHAGPIATSFFALDLVLRGGFFDIMEHFELTVTAVSMNRALRWFVLYAFVFRIYYGLTLIRIVVSFVWMWAKLRAVSKQQHADRNNA
ncbi:MAG: hypothetical protein KDJ47_18165 [Hyphomicrobiaceae bacterium]|nr:hypothetical protein [Hyphomicrobiaceae bacterium]